MRAPPGGASTFTFGDWTAEKEEAQKAASSPARNRQSTNGAQGGQQQSGSGLSPAMQKQIQQMMSSTTDVNELVKKIQQLAGLGSGQPSGALRSTDTAGGEQSRGMKPSGSKVDAARNALHDAFAKRGCDTLLRLSKKFKIMDDDNSGGLSYEEFKKGLAESGLKLGEAELQALFRSFDADCSGYVDAKEFTEGMRPPMSERRKKLVMEAFKTMDSNNDGALTVDDMTSRYDTSRHPDVVGGAHGENDVRANFLAMFDGTLGSKSAVVTPEKFLQYYQHVSASIDGDDYFELVLRNVWHLDGGNTSRRLLVTHEDGTQTVETIGDDFEVSRDDLKAIKENLREQGVPVVKVALYGYTESIDSGGPGLLSTGSSPKKAAAGAGAAAASPVREASQQENLEPEAAAMAYKQRMAQSNVSFA